MMNSIKQSVKLVTSFESKIYTRSPDVLRYVRVFGERTLFAPFL